ncbi:WxL domain-containing protein [Enterococcus faecalis]|uniref:WxL domain-containing protein n=1 Tax=Enterococcus faecalis TaxID=1351 RepID=UPI001D140F6F|nr:WxL domain-containing protein [Enterococcus faecalis]MBE8842072.1 WxL domain-containing protein [Enterococcus faecalis]
MKQIKFKQLATFGLCCSLLVNSFTGVTAVAETVTIESSPTAESTKESPKESTETSEATTETSREEATQETEKQEKVKEAETEAAQVEVEQEETKTSEVIQPHSVPVPTSGIGVRAGNLETVQQQISSLISSKSFTTSNSIAMPAGKMGLNLVTDDKTLVKLEDFSLTANITTLLTSRSATSAQVTKRPASVSASSTGFDILMDATGTMSLNVVMRRIYLDDVTLKVPKYIENVVLNGDIVGTGSTTSPEWVIVRKATATKLNDTSYELGNYSDAPPIYNVSRLNSMYHYLNYMGNPTSSVSVFVIQNLPKSDYTLTVTNRKVTENFKDVNGTAIPAPTGFTQGKKTSITNNDYTFKQSGTLPDTYTAGGKTYKFKGWYKGKTKPATLETSKTPSYKVTYDNNDDLNVVYEEMVEQTKTIPAVTYKFGFVDEKGTLVTPNNFVMQTNLTTVINKIPKQVGTAKGVSSGDLKHLTIPSQALTHTPVTNPAFSGATDFQLTVPKYYKMPTVKPGEYYTGSSTAYPIATSRLRFINNASPDERLEVNGEQYGLRVTSTAHSYGMYQDYWKLDTTKTLFNGVLSRAVTDSTLGNSQPNYYTTDNTMYYFLENRRVTENFVDATGAKITPPTGFTQGKQTVIDSSPYTFKQSGTLPYIYKINNKPYVLKGWYKGKDKPAKLNQISADNRNISYPVSYDDQDDVTVVYDELKLGDKTIQFGFVNEQGKYIPPTSNFNVSTDVGVVTNATFAKLQTVNSSVKGNYLSLTVPAYNPTGGLGQGDIYYGTLNSIVTIPKYYKTPTLTPSSHYQGTAYPTVTGVIDFHNSTTNEYLPNRLNLHSVNGSQTNYKVHPVLWENEETKTPFASLYKMSYSSVSDTTMTLVEYYATGTVNYYLENRRVTENFVDASGTKITPPTGFTQGKQTVIDSDPYIFKQSGTLPDTYKANGKTYKFKGWYKRTTTPSTLETSKTPSYPVTYDGNDDLNVVYEEIQAIDVYPSMNVNFIDENEVGFTPELTFNGKYRVQRTSDLLFTDLYDLTVKNNDNGQYILSVSNGSIPLSPNLFQTYGNGIPINGLNQLKFRWDQIAITNQMKYVDSIELDTRKTNYNVTGYTYTPNALAVFDETQTPTKRPSTSNSIMSFTNSDGYFTQTDSALLYMDVATSLNAIRMFGFDATNTTKDTAVYKVTRKQVTERFVDETGAEITPPTGFAQGDRVPMTSNTFKYTTAKTLPQTYNANGKSYIFQGWYKGRTKPTELTETMTPTFDVTFDGNDDMTAVYKEETATAEVSMKGAVTIIPNDSNQHWYVTIANTGKVPLSNIKMKPTSNFAAGLSQPDQANIRIGTTMKFEPITATSWKTGVPIPDIPVGQSAQVMFSTVGTGQPMELLQAEVLVSGNFTSQTASAIVRIQGSDQTITDPVGEGFISVPTFDFGQVGIAGVTTQHGLKKADDYYGNGTRNPFVRIKKSQPNWSLTAQLSQPKSATDSLPTTTRLLLGKAPVSKVDNYNLVTEIMNPVGTTPALSLTANNTVTNVITDKQFTGNDVYQLDFAFDNVKLEIPANQGVKGQQYQAAVTWNLVTGP